MLGIGLLWGCERGFPQAGSEPTIEEDRFVAVMADLRGEMQELDGRILGEAERGTILQRHGVTEEDLLHFADNYGPDVSFMHRVWTRVDSTMAARTAEPGSPGDGGAEGAGEPEEGDLPGDALDGAGA